jgi:predicted RNase H-like HicB family nuclease
MSVTVAIHLDPTESDVVWWAESADLPGFSAAAPTLRDLRKLIDEAVSMEVGEAEIDLQLVGEEPAREAPEVMLKGAPAGLSAADRAQLRLLSSLDPV